MRKSDTALMERWIAARDPEAFAQLVDRHAGMVLTACRRVLGNHADAEETAQECFLQVSQAQRAVSPSLGGWLHRLATNRALDRLRSDTARATRERNYAAGQAGSTEPTWNDIQPHVDAIIAQLPDELQTPLVLHFFEGQTHREVARALGIGRSTVTERIQRAIVEIREQLEAKNITLCLAALAGLFGALEVSAAPPTFIASLKKIGIATGRPSTPARYPMKWRAAVAVAIVALMAGLWVLNRGAVARGARDVATRIETKAEAGGEGPKDVPEKAAQIVAPVAKAADMTLTRVESLVAPLPEEQEMIRLRCVDEQGKPVAGAEVYYMWTEFGMAEMLQVDRPENVTRQAFGPVRADAKGYVEVPATRTPTQTSYGYASAYARIPGRLVGLWHHSPRSLEIAGWDSIVMVPSTSIQGVVTVPAGFDVTKVTVKVLTIRLSLGDYPFDTTIPVSSKYLPPLWPTLFQTIPSRDGVYRLMDLPQGHTCYLEFSTPGLGEAQRFNFTIDGNESVDAELFLEGSISGVVRHATGEPATDVPVFACPSIAAASSIGVCTAFQARTDDRGHYTIKGMPEATYSVLVQHYGAPPMEISRVLPTVKVMRGEKHEGIDFQMEHGALQSGILIDGESGVPIEGARIVAMNSGAYELTSMEQAIGSVQTDRNGKFTFRLPTGNSSVYFFETPEEYVEPEEQGRTPIQVMPGQTEMAPLTLHLTRKSAEERAPIDKATIEGRVVDEERRPVAGVPVRVNQMTRPGVQLPFESEARPTDEDGHFSVSVLSVGEHQIIVGGGGVSSRVESEWFAVQADERKSVGDLQVAPYDKDVIVILSRFNIDPAVKLPYVSAKNRDTLEDVASGFVDESGRIALNAPDIPLLLTISQEGCKVLQVDAEPGTEMEVTLEPEESEIEE